MKITGIIAEYNPFHQGHAYHLSEARKKTQADFILVVMSGNYVQRGVPAMFDKYTRAKAALLHGADIVLELPISAATGSAEFFAKGAISLLLDTGIVTDLCFGSECGNLEALKKTAAILAKEPEEFQSLLRQYLKTGESFPKARALALSKYDASLSSELVNQPNNLLGLEYLKALQQLDCEKTIKVHTILRQGSAYHEQNLKATPLASASAIRAALIREKGHFTNEILTQLPSGEVYQDYQEKEPITENAFSLLLLQKLRSIQGQPLQTFFDVNEELSNRIWKQLDNFTSFEQFTDCLKTKNLTRTAISRALLHILLDIKAYEKASAFRILGFRKEAAPLLKELSIHGNLPIISRLTDERINHTILYPDYLYESVRSLLHQQPFQNEYKRKMLVL